MFGHQYKKIKDDAVKSKSSGTVELEDKDMQKKAEEIAMRAGMVAYQQRSRIRNFVQNDSFVAGNSNVVLSPPEIFVIDGYYGKENFKPYDESAFSITATQTKKIKKSCKGDLDVDFFHYSQPYEHLNIPVNSSDAHKLEQYFSTVLDGDPRTLSSNERLKARKTFTVAECMVTSHGGYGSEIKPVGTYPSPIKVCLFSQAARQLEQFYEEARHGIILPENLKQFFASKLVNQDEEAFFAQRYEGQDHFTTHEEAVARLDGRLENDDYKAILLNEDQVKNDPDAQPYYYSLEIQNDKYGPDYDNTDLQKGIFYNKKAEKTSLIEDIYGILRGFVYKLDVANSKRQTSDSNATALTGYFKLVVAGTGMFANYLNKWSLDKESIGVFFESAIQAFFKLAESNVLQQPITIEFPLFGEAIQHYQRYFDQDMLNNLKTRGINVVAGVQRDLLDFTHLEKLEQYYLGGTTAADVIAAHGNELGWMSVEAGAGENSSLPQTHFWAYNFARLFAPKNIVILPSALAMAPTNNNNNNSRKESDIITAADLYEGYQQQYENLDFTAMLQKFHAGLVEAFVSDLTSNKELNISETQAREIAKKQIRLPLVTMENGEDVTKHANNLVNQCYSVAYSLKHPEEQSCCFNMSCTIS